MTVASILADLDEVEKWCEAIPGGTVEQAIERIRAFLKAKPVCGDFSPTLPNGPPATCALAPGHAGPHTDATGEYPLLWMRARDGGSDGSNRAAPGDLNFYDDTLHVDLWYPNIEREPKDPPRTFDHPVAVQVGLMHVRAADDIRIEYDFARDGYVIKQGSIFEWPADDKVCDRDWQEVAFVEAWGREIEKPTEPAT